MSEFNTILHDALERQRQELKPCPFCGAKNPILVRYAKGQSVDGQPIRGIWIGCRCCEASVFYRFEKEAIEAWNRRAGDGE